MGADGRATFEYGDEVTEGERHVVWRASVHTQCSAAQAGHAAFADSHELLAEHGVRATRPMDERSDRTDNTAGC